MSIDDVAIGALLGKSSKYVKALLKDMIANNYHWSNERATPKRSSGKYEVDAVTLLAGRVDVLAHRLDRVGTFLVLGHSSGTSIGVYAICETCGGQGYTSTESYNGPSTIEHANAPHRFNLPP